MKVKPGSLNFCVMERSKFVALFPFSAPPPLSRTRYPHHIPGQWLRAEMPWLLDSRGGAKAFINCWCHSWVTKPSGDKYSSYRISFKLQTGSLEGSPPPIFMLSRYPIHFPWDESLIIVIIIIFKFVMSKHVMNGKYQFRKVIFNSELLIVFLGRKVFL